MDWIDVDGKGICTVTIPGEKGLNILTEDALRRLIEGLHAVARRPEIRVVIVKGRTSKAFVGGADIKRMALLAPDSARDFIRLIGDACDAIRVIPVPTVALIEGFCLGAGMELAACCDMRIAASTARFGMPEVRIGIPSVVHAALLPGLIGPGAANWLLMTGEIVDATQAQRWGFLQFREEGEMLAACVARTVDAICAGGPHAIRDQKALIRFWEANDLESGVKLSVERFAAAFEGDEPARYMAPFLVKRAEQGGPSAGSGVMAQHCAGDHPASGE